MNDLSVKCPKCREEFQNPIELREHRLKDHNILSKVQLVNLVEQKANKKAESVKTKEIRAFYYCVRCKGEFDTAKELWTHREKDHNGSICPQLVKC